MKRYSITIGRQISVVVMLLLIATYVSAQTFVGSGTMTGTPAAGSYFNYTGITLTNFTFTASTGNSLHIYTTSPGCVILASAPSSNQNYVRTSVPLKPGYVHENTSTNTTCDVMQTIQYVDGLGRPIQTVQVKGSPTVRDVVQAVEYDIYGRETKKYLPYANLNGTDDGSYKPNAISTDQPAFYATPPSGIKGTSYPFAVTEFEASPLNRVLKQGAPGTDWQISAGHTVDMAYSTNTTGEVPKWTVNSGGNGASINSSSYDAGTLYKNITTDENEHNTITYTDMDGRVVRKSVDKTGGGNYIHTDYVYDDFGNLAYVIPPVSTTSFAETDAVFLNFIYGYHYDERNRLVEKKVPGKGWEYMVYNKLDQVAMTQDAVQRGKSPQQWSFTKYDAFGRVIMTGIYTDDQHSDPNTNYRLNFQGIVNYFPSYETRDHANNTTGYTNQAIPMGSITENLTYNYYDDYVNIPGMPITYSAPTGAIGMPKGLLTATLTNVLGTSNMLLAVNYYDDLGHNMVTYKQHYLSGAVNPANFDVISTTYDFINNPVNINREHKVNGSTALTVINTYTYDHMGRKKQTTEKIINTVQPNPAPTILSNLQYNEVGQLLTKQLHKPANGGSYLQNISYAYNERGWLTNSTAPLFAMQLKYNDGTVPQWNGNITNQLWGPGSLTKTYTYSYDAMNRLVKGTSTTGNDETGPGGADIDYDNLGNIKYLTRTGTQPAVLAYDYSSNTTSQLQSVANGSNPTFRTYGYDGNGNATTDGTGNTINYNLLNLPATIPGKSLTYVYDATGNKLRKISSGNATDYIDGIVYDGGSLSFLQNEEGRVLNLTGTPNYEYSLKDHLGNTRVTFDSNGGAVAKQTDDYYPFGLVAYQPSTPSPENKYLYNGKELQSELTQYDYGARFYDPIIGRWTSVDPSAENDAAYSPYIYGFNNSIRFTDPDGRWPDGGCCGVVGSFVGGLYNNLKGAVVGTVDAVMHPVQTVSALHKLTSNPVTQIQAGVALYNSATEGIQNFKAGDANVKAAMIGGLVGEVGQLFGGEIAEIGKIGRVGKIGEVGKVAEAVNDVNKTNDVFVVTRDGVALPKGDKYKIPDNLVENPNRSGSYGTMENGKFKKEKLRIDPATPPGKKGPNTSHYHKDNKSTHYVPDGKDPGFN